MTAIVCTRCKKEGQVPFVPTPGRPVLCSNCHRRARDAPLERPRIPLPPRRRMLSMKRKGHFVYDALQVLDEEDGDLDAERRRTFVEMVFARGSRQTIDAAEEFIEEKAREGTLTEEQAGALVHLVRDYSKKQ